ncbi:MAG: hypothetical protein ACREDE_08450, partial [Thermoplasmata archaeon]
MRTGPDGQPRASVRGASWPGDINTVRRFFQDYRQWLADRQDTAALSAPRVRDGLARVDRLVRELPGAYGPPHGEVLLWIENESVVACGALRELGPKIGEIRRIYVRSAYQG